MPFAENDGIRYYTFESFPESVVQAVFTRRGGTSPQPWDSLNVGGTVGDELEHVRENRLRSFAALRRAPESLFDVWQVHSAEVVIAEAPKHTSPPEYKADAILTDRPGVTLFMRFADCVPIMLFDPRRRAVGIVHAGWMGTVQRIAEKAVRAMQAAYGSRPEDIRAAIGPSIGPDHYEVGADVVARVNEAFGEDAGAGLLHGNGSGMHLDLWQANRLTLEQAGVGRVEVAGLCTACHPQDWYSHRAQKGRTGRFGALIALKD